MTTRYNVVSELQNYMFSAKIKEMPPVIVINPVINPAPTKNPIIVKQRDLFFTTSKRFLVLVFLCYGKWDYYV